MTREDVHTLLLAIRESLNPDLEQLSNYVTIDEVILALSPHTKEENIRDQKLLSTHEIRQQWFDANLAHRSIAVNVPQFIANPNARRFAKVPRQVKPTPFQIMLGKLGRRGFKLHYRPTHDKCVVPTLEQPLNKPEIKPSEIVTRRAEINRANAERQFYTPLDKQGRAKKRMRAERKLSVAKLMAGVPNPTNRAIDRYQYMQLVHSQDFPGLPATYLNRENVRYRD